MNLIALETEEELDAFAANVNAVGGRENMEIGFLN